MCALYISVWQVHRSHEKIPKSSFLPSLSFVYIKTSTLSLATYCCWRRYRSVNIALILPMTFWSGETSEPSVSFHLWESSACHWLHCPKLLVYKWPVFICLSLSTELFTFQVIPSVNIIHNDVYMIYCVSMHCVSSGGISIFKYSNFYITIQIPSTYRTEQIEYYKN